jgi:hypothetical protein
VLKPFPVGRRIAFDPHRGRLWVLCSACRSWNLAPLEERWEAVEAAERLFERAALGASTQNVALGRVQEGTELLRIGKVDRPEFAAWRYGRTLARRRRRFWLDPWAYGSGIALGGATIGAAAAGVVWAPLIVPVAGAGYLAYGLRSLRRTVLNLGPDQPVYASRAWRARFVSAQDGKGWALAVPLMKGEEITLATAETLRLLRTLLPEINYLGGTTTQVREAVAELDRCKSVEDAFGAVA